MKDNESLERKLIAQKRVKILLIVLNSLLAVGLILDVTLNLVFNHTKSDNFITLTSYNKEESQEIYQELIVMDEDDYVVDDCYDYGVYGSYLCLSQYKITPGNFNSYTNLYLKQISQKNGVNVLYNSTCQISLDSKFVNGGIDLASLNYGDYIVYDDIISESNYSFPHKAIKLAWPSAVNEVYYTPINNDHYRKKITILNNEVSPCLVIRVEKVTTIEKDYYDYVVVGSSDNSFCKSLSVNDKYVIANSLKEAYLYKSMYAYVLDDEIGETTTSYYLNDSFKKDELTLDKYDANKYIRELGGYLFNAGSCTEGEESTFEVALVKESHDAGKLTYLVNPNNSK